MSMLIAALLCSVSSCVCCIIAVRETKRAGTIQRYLDLECSKNNMLQEQNSDLILRVTNAECMLNKVREPIAPESEGGHE